MGGEEVFVIGQLRNVIIVGPERNVNTTDYSSAASMFFNESADLLASSQREKSLADLKNHYVGELQSLTD